MKQNEKLSLPIDLYIPEILRSLTNYSTIIVKASPGSGKTTRLPWAIANDLKKRVVVLEPRRLAAKLAAVRISEEESLIIGQDVGFHFRFEKNCTDQTPLIFYTEGTFLKKFIQDPLIKDVDVIILDEFHERHIETDLALALIQELQTKRPIKLVLMSATLDTNLLTALPKSTFIHIEAPIFPVEITYLPNVPSILNQTLEQKVKKAVDISHEGDILIFLPGMKEMLKVQKTLHNHNVLLLHADLSKEEQQLALLPSNQRKIILATNIAESSLTIPGINTVIDSGIQRQARYSAWNGLKFIQDHPTTKSSAIQRAGRAGRTSSGYCHRLYTEQDFNQRQEHTIPEIETADLTDVCLLISGIGLNPMWFTAPNPEKWKRALKLLESLEAIHNNELTVCGKKMLEYPLDSRLSRILVAGEEVSSEEKKNLIHYICFDIEEDRTGTLQRRLGYYLKRSGTSSDSWEKCVLTGFVDQVAKYRQKQKDFIHCSGKIIKPHLSLNDLQEGYYLILDITQKQEAIKILPIEESWLWDLVPFPIIQEDEVQVNENVQIRRKTKYGSIVTHEEEIHSKWSTLANELKLKIAQLSIGPAKQRMKILTESSEYERIHYWSRLQSFELDVFLKEVNIQEYFEMNQELNFNNFNQYIIQKIHYEFDLELFEKNLPQKISLNGKKNLIIHYPLGMEPFLEAPIQDFYGLMQTPTIMCGKIPLTLKLIGPHKRPMQITKDLKNFWNKTYQEMKKEYQRDYPRHYWPDRPWEAEPVLLKRMLPQK